MNLASVEKARVQARNAYWDWMCRWMHRRANGRVHEGPFAGMRYEFGAVCSASVPKLLGTYEKELHGVVEGLASKRWASVIDVGAAEGYYAVGFAMRLRDARVIAYEMDANGRNLLRRNATSNGVIDRLDVRGECTASDLDKAIADAERPTLVVLDVEGAEADLIRGVAAERRKTVTFLIEVHDFASKGNVTITAQLHELLGATHKIETLRSRRRERSDFPLTFWLVPSRNRLHAMDEYRPGTMEWMLCTPK